MLPFLMNPGSRAQAVRKYSPTSYRLPPHSLSSSISHRLSLTANSRRINTCKTLSKQIISTPSQSTLTQNREGWGLIVSHCTRRKNIVRDAVHFDAHDTPSLRAARFRRPASPRPIVFSAWHRLFADDPALLPDAAIRPMHSGARRQEHPGIHSVGTESATRSCNHSRCGGKTSPPRSWLGALAGTRAKPDASRRAPRPDRNCNRQRCRGCLLAAPRLSYRSRPETLLSRPH